MKKLTSRLAIIVYKETTEKCGRQQPQSKHMKFFDGIKELFDEFLQFQFDKSTKIILSYMYGKKIYLKKYLVDPEYYKLLCIALSVIKNFKTWMHKDDLSESAYVRKFAEILDVLLARLTM